MPREGRGKASVAHLLSSGGMASRLELEPRPKARIPATQSLHEPLRASATHRKRHHWPFLSSPFRFRGMSGCARVIKNVISNCLRRDKLSPTSTSTELVELSMNEPQGASQGRRNPTSPPRVNRQAIHEKSSASRSRSSPPFHISYDGCW